MRLPESLLSPWIWVHSKQEHKRHLLKWQNICPSSSYPFYIVTYYIKWVTTSWTPKLELKHTVGILLTIFLILHGSGSIVEKNLESNIVSIGVNT